MWCFRWEVVARIIACSEGVVGLKIGTGESMHACLDFWTGGLEEFDGGVGLEGSRWRRKRVEKVCF